MTQSIPENALILVADGRKGIFFRTLGQLRDAMHKTVADSVVTTLTKDLTNHSTSDIASALKAHIQK